MMLCGYAILATVAMVVPLPIPVVLPTLRNPLWFGIAVVAAGLWVLVARQAGRRAIVLLAGWVLVVLTVVQAFVVNDLLALLGLWFAVPILALLAGQVRPKARKALVATHVIASASWVGITATIVAMSVVAMTTRDAEVMLVTYRLMESFDLTLLPWANFASTLSGIAVGIVTPWGLVRYYWVAIKLAISVSILVLAFGFLHNRLVAAAADADRLATTGAAPDLGSLPETVFGGFTFALINLVAAVLLSLYKPGGKTKRGKRTSARPRRVANAAVPVTVADKRVIADGTVALALRPIPGQSLPTWEPGAHIDVVLPSGRQRQYSLFGDPAERDTYRIAVLKEPNGRGGSTEIHGLPVGATIGIRGPRNNFPLAAAPAYLFVAGGIGITPFLPMIHRLASEGADWRLVYRGRSLTGMAFAEMLVRRYPGRVTLAPSDTTPRPNLAQLLRSTPGGTAVYCCGPETLMKTMETLMPVACPHGTLHTERFAASGRADTSTDLPFEAEFRRSGEVVTVPAGQSLLAAIQDVDPSVDLSCENGICGSCATRVLAGTPDHRDDVLQPHERNRTDVIYPCVSRALGQRIVLDI
nr:Flavodoxin reductases (ferredoxin-NADPH reductases) family 1; Vanillate O-demethylase oxidoreductase [Kibdelosporangium sp. MJ126-NF4]